MKLKGINEFELIERLTFDFKKGKSLIKSIGDDTAVIRYKKGTHLLLTTDILIENVHFKIKEASAQAIGHKALACNISDIAAMGGVPKYAVVSLGLSKDLSLDFVKSIYKGIKRTAKLYDVEIVGGDISRSKKLIINIALIGFAKSKNLTLRDKAKVNDRIFVTGYLGGSLKKKHLTFKPRLKEALILTTKYKINSMIDLSDGLASDLKRIIEESRVGAFIYTQQLPLSKDANSVYSALYDGEDFELLFTVNEKEAKRLNAKSSNDLRIQVTEIGIIVNKKEGFKLIDRKGRKKDISLKKGFKHF